MKLLIVFYNCNISFLLNQLQCNKLLQVHSSPQCIFKAEGTHNSKKIICKPGGTWIQKQHILSPPNPGPILEECMWGIIVSTKEHVYCLGKEGNQCRVKKKGEINNEGKIWDINSLSNSPVIPQISVSHYFNTPYLLCKVFYFLNRCPPFKHIMSVILCYNNTLQHSIYNLQYFLSLYTHTGSIKHM